MARATGGAHGRSSEAVVRPPVEESVARSSAGTPLAALVIVAATALVYSNTFDASFHFDDVSSIVENDALRDLGRHWPPSGRRWVGYLTFALNYRLGGLEVFGYHLVNLAIHACNGLLVFWLARLTLRTPVLRSAEAGPLVRRCLPLAAGLLFALHPIATQAVTYVVQRLTSLATLFFLLSLCVYVATRLSAEREGTSKRRTALLCGLSLLAAIAAMKTKEISFTLPLVAAGYELLFFPRERRRLLLVAPLAATALLVPLGITLEAGRSAGDMLGDASQLTAATREIDRWVYLLTQSRVVVSYLRLLLVPVGQSLEHDVRLSRSLAEPEVILALAVLLGVAAGAGYLLVRARRTNQAPGYLAAFGVAWFFVTLSVESSFIPIRDVMFEHRVYLPSAGASVALSTALLWCVERLPWRAALRVQATAALLATAVPLGAATYARNLVWKDEVTLWSDAVAKSPGKSGPHNNLGLAYQANGRIREAIREFAEAIRIESSGPEIRGTVGLAELHDNLGLAYRARGALDDAIREHREAIRLDPTMAAAHVNVGLAYEGKGDVDEASREYREAARLAPAWAEAYVYLGGFLARRGRYDEAAAAYRRALELKPRPGIVFDLAGALESAGRGREAIVHYQRFLDEGGELDARRADVARRRIARLRAPP